MLYACVCVRVNGYGYMLVRGKKGCFRQWEPHIRKLSGEEKHSVFGELKKGQCDWNLQIIAQHAPHHSPFLSRFFKLRYILHKIECLRFSVQVNEFW